MKTLTGPACGLEKSYRKLRIFKCPKGHLNIRGFFLHQMGVEHWKKSTNGREGAGSEIMTRLPDHP
jgi:hypothetical protein